jgi:hypothetical protein
MKPWYFAGVGLALLATLGCRSDPAISVLERELRLKEDEVYRLRSKVEDLQDCAADSQQRAGTSKRDSESEGRSKSSTGSPGKASPGQPASVAPPSVEYPNSGSTDVPPLFKSQGGSNPAGGPPAPKQLPGPAPSYLPGIDNGGKIREPSRDAGKSSSNADYLDGPALDGPPRTRGAAPRGARGRFVANEGKMPGGTAAGDNRRIASIALDPMLTGGINGGGGSDKGLLVVVVPRDAENRVIDAPGDVSVAVLDPAVLDRAGYAARVARWDFTAAEIATMFRRTNAGPAIHIETTWPDGPPAHSKLHVFVRYATADGRKLEANQPIEVAPAGEKRKSGTTASAGATGSASAAGATTNPRSVPGSPSNAENTAGQANYGARAWSPERR